MNIQDFVSKLKQQIPPSLQPFVKVSLFKVIGELNVKIDFGYTYSTRNIDWHNSPNFVILVTGWGSQDSTDKVTVSLTKTNRREIPKIRKKSAVTPEDAIRYISNWMVKNQDKLLQGEPYTSKFAKQALKQASVDPDFRRSLIAKLAAEIMGKIK